MHIGSSMHFFVRLDLSSTTCMIQIRSTDPHYQMKDVENRKLLDYLKIFKYLTYLRVTVGVMLICFELFFKEELSSLLIFLFQYLIRPNIDILHTLTNFFFFVKRFFKISPDSKNNRIYLKNKPS